MRNFRAAITIVAIGLAVVMQAGVMAKVDVKVEFDKRFDFKPVKTWAWNREGPGEVKMARTPTDDPDAMRQRAEPIIVDSVTASMAERGLKEATSTPDLTVRYYLLLTAGTSAQTMNQFLPATTWGLPLFAPATQSLQVMNQGSLVLDLSANGEVVWRGVARAQIKTDSDSKKRESLIREAVRDLLKRYPPKS